MAAEVGAVEAVEPRDIISVVDAQPLLPAHIVELCRWIADYYMAGIGDAIALAMPPGAARKASSFKTQRIVSATALGLETVRTKADTMYDKTQYVASGFSRTGTKQTGALEQLAGAPLGLRARALRERGFGPDVIARLVAKGLATIRHEADERDPFGRAAAMDVVAPDERRQLTHEQDVALARLAGLAEQRAFHV